MIRLTTPLRSRVIVIAQPVASMKPCGILMDADQRLGGARVHRDIGSAKFDRIESIARCLLHIYVAGHGCDRSNAYVRRAQSHDQCDRVIRGGVGIDEKGATHARKNSRTTIRPTRLWPLTKQCRVTRFPRETACSRRKRFGIALVMMITSAICWGSWANTFKGRQELPLRAFLLGLRDWHFSDLAHSGVHHGEHAATTPPVS